VLMLGGFFFNVIALFKYLGSYISRTGSDTPDVDRRDISDWSDVRRAELLPLPLHLRLA